MNMSAHAYDQYQRTSFDTLTPGRLLVMLYDGAIKNLRNAREAIENQDIPGAHGNIINAQKIVIELMTTLNMDYKISESLLALYEFMHHQLVEANVKKDPDALLEVQQMLMDLRETWEQAIRSLGRSGVYHGNTLKALNISG